MKRVVPVFIVAVCLSFNAQAFWPFGSDEEDEDVRLSELMEPATALVDEASDLAADGKVDEAVAKYRAALVELDRIERANPKRMQKPEMATLRTKRAYVSAAVDSLLMGQARDNAKPVAVSDTAELERRLAAEKGQKTPEKEVAPKSVKKVENAKRRAEKPKAEFTPRTLREQIMANIMSGNFESAELEIKKLLENNPSNAMALNLQAALEAERGDLKAASRALDKAIDTNPRDYFAYYNMAELMLRMNEKEAAKRYYETGRAFNGPQDAALEEMLK